MNVRLLDLLVALAIGAIVMIGVWFLVIFLGGEFSRAGKQAEMQRITDLVAQALKREADASVRIGTAGCGTGSAIRLHRVEANFSVSPVTMREEFRCIFNAGDQLWWCHLVTYDDSRCSDDPILLVPLPNDIQVIAEFVAETAAVPQYTPVATRVVARRKGFKPYILPLLLVNKGHLP